MKPVHQRISDARDRTLQRLKEQAARVVLRRFQDARSYADRANPAVATALDRLDELGDVLAQTLSDARAGFYRQAFDLHRLDWDPDVHQDVYPDPDGETAARTAQIAGIDQARDLNKLVESAKQELRTTVAATLPLAAWEHRHRDAISSRIKRHLNDAQVALHEAVGQVLIKPHLR